MWLDASSRISNFMREWILYPAPAVNSGCPAWTMRAGGIFGCPEAGMGCGAVFAPFLIQPENRTIDILKITYNVDG